MYVFFMFIINNIILEVEYIFFCVLFSVFDVFVVEKSLFNLVEIFVF